MANATAAENVTSAAANAVQAAPSAPSYGSGDMLVTVGYFVLMLGIIFLAFWLIKKYAPQGFGTQRTKGGPKLLGRLMLGPRQNVSVVEYGGRRLILGVTEHQINLLGEAYETDDDEEATDTESVFAKFLKRPDTGSGQEG